MGKIENDEEKRRTQTRFWLSVLRLHSAVFAELNRRMLNEAGVSLAKFDAMAQLARTSDGLSMGQLSSALKVSNGNVSGLVTRLTKDGMVVKVMSTEDRRSFSAKLTEGGRAKFETAKDVHDRILADLLIDVSDQDMATADASLRKILNEMQPGERLG